MLSIALNLLITIAEVVGGILSGSLALLSDALHNFSDTSTLAISYVTRRVSKRAANDRMTFGYRRAEIIGAFINLLTLVMVAGVLIKEAVERLAAPQEIAAPLMITVATIGLAANVATALLLHRDARANLNIRSAYLHVVTDAISSVAVIVGGLLVWWRGWYIVDPILTMIISLYIMFFSYQTIRRIVDILMEGTPAGLEVPEIVNAIEAVDGVVDAHHVHVWQLDEHAVALEAHISVLDGDLRKSDKVKARIKRLLRAEFGIDHSTLEFETEGHCSDADCFDETVPMVAGQDRS